MKRRRGAGAIAAMTLACVFGAALLVSLAAGAGVYRRVAERVEAGSVERVGMTYITARIRAGDAAGAVRAGSFGGEDAVFLTQELSGVTYETALYVHDGWLMELFSEQGAEMEPADGQTIARARSLSVTETAPDLLTLEYVSGDGHAERTNVYLRSGE